MRALARSIEKAISVQPGTAANSGADGKNCVTKGEGGGNVAPGSNGASESVTAEDVNQMVQNAIQKAMQPKEEILTRENVQEYIEAAVAKAMEPVLKSTGLPTNLNDEGIQKGAEEQHYLHGII